MARNPVIASLLHRINYIERIGTGINRIRNAVKEHGKCAVTFELTGFFTVLFLRLQSPSKKYENQIIKENGELNGELNERQKSVLHMIKAEPGINATELAEKLQISFHTIDKYVRLMIKKNYIERKGGKKKGGYWTVKNGKTRREGKQKSD